MSDKARPAHKLRDRWIRDTAQAERQAAAESQAA